MPAIAKSQGVSFCSADTNAAAAAEIMIARDCDVLLVIEDGGRVAGVVTDFDLFIVLSSQTRSACHLSVSEIMSPPPVGGGADDPERFRQIVSLNNAISDDAIRALADQ
jgi:CBS domain-containing protein